MNDRFPASRLQYDFGAIRDSKPTQRIGIVPDIVVRPTITGIRAGRD